MFKLNIQLFASAKKSDETYSSAGNKGTIYVSFNENSTNTEKNTSNITVYASFKMTGNFNTPGSTHSLKVYWYDNNKNENVSVQEKTIKAMSNGDVLEVGDTIDVSHLSDGSLSGYAWVAWTKQNDNKYVPVSKTVSTDWTALTNIPRATSCPDVTATIGNQHTLTINPASPYFSHKFIVSFGDNSQEGWFEDSTSTKWTPKLEFMNEIPNASSGTGKISLYTYRGESLIGTSEGNLTLSANENLARPTVSLSVYDSNSVTTSLTGNNQKFIKGYSNAVCTPSIQLKYGASVSNKSINGVSFTENTITFNGTTKSVFALDVTDSRGYGNKATAGADGNLINYSPLIIKNVSVVRTEPTSTTANINVRLNYWSDNFGAIDNHLIGQYRYREANYGEWSEYVPMEFTISGTDAICSTSTNNLDWKKSYDFQFVFEDALNIIGDSELLPKGIESFSIGDNFIATPHIYLIDENTGDYRQIY